MQYVRIFDEVESYSNHQDFALEVPGGDLVDLDLLENEYIGLFRKTKHKTYIMFEGIG